MRTGFLQTGTIRHGVNAFRALQVLFPARGALDFQGLQLLYVLKWPTVAQLLQTRIELYESENACISTWMMDASVNRN